MLGKVNFLIISILFLPISIYSFKLLDISPSIFILAYPLIFYRFIRLKSTEVIPLILSIILWIISFLLYSTIEKNVETKHILSFLLTIFPLMFYYIGVMFSNTSNRFIEYFVQYWSVLFSIFVTFILGSILFSGNEIRMGGVKTIDGSSIYGEMISFQNPFFDLYGAWGVHSFTAFLVVSFIVCLGGILNNHLKNNLLKVITCVGLCCSLYIMVFAFSRETWLVLFLLCIKIIVDTFKRHPAHSLITVVTLISITFFMYGEFNQTFFWERQQKYFMEGDLNAFSSGRLNTLYYGLQSILEHPTSIASYHFTMADNSTLHNQPLTYLYKLGILSGLLLIMQVYMFCNHSLKKMAPNILFNIPQNIIFASLLLAMFWDILSVSLVGAFIFFMLGLYARQKTNSG